VRSWRRAGRSQRRRSKLPRCTKCSQPIPRSEPDVILESLRVGGFLHFHERCGVDAYMAAVGGGPGAWRVYHRHVHAEAN
jgi:hypothetical protein